MSSITFGIGSPKKNMEPSGEIVSPNTSWKVLITMCFSFCMCVGLPVTVFVEGWDPYLRYVCHICMLKGGNMAP